MAEYVYAACSLTSLACAGLLVRQYLHSRVRLVLWTSLCFVGLMLNNILLFIDRVIVPTGPDLSILRLVPALVGVGILVSGLIWDSV